MREPKLLKRLAFFTNMYAILIGLSVLILINKRDSKRSAWELWQTTALPKIASLDMQDLAKVINQKAGAHMMFYNPSSYITCQRNSKRFSEIVASYGVSWNEGPKDTSFKYDGTSIFLAKVIPNLDKVPNGYALNDLMTYVTRPLPITEATVKALSDKAIVLSVPTKVQYIQAFDEELLISKLDTVIMELANTLFPRSNIHSIAEAKEMLRGNSKIHFNTYIEDSILGFYFFIDPGISTYGASIPIKTSYFSEHPSIFDLLDKPEYNSLKHFYLRPDFGQSYQHLMASEAIKQLSEESVREYRSISIFGFDFSRRSLPFAMGFFCMVTAIGTFSVIRIARKHGLKIISEATDEQVSFMLIERQWSRAIFWCVGPFFIMYSAAPQFSWSIWNNFGYYYVMLFTIALGVVTFIRSLKV